MKTISYFAFSAALFCLASCSDSKPAVSTTPAPAVTNQAPAQTNTQPSTPTSTVALNPAHGEPGHRCDIQVGEPLNSAPTTAPVPSAPTLSAPVFTPPPAPGSVAKGTNPPHGQPGHDCAKPVGAPL